MADVPSITAPVTTGRDCRFANEDSPEKINRRIITLFEMAEVVPKADCGHTVVPTLVNRPLEINCADGGMELTEVTRPLSKRSNSA